MKFRVIVEKNHLRQGSWSGDQRVHSPDGEQGNRGEGQDPAERGGPDRSHQSFPQAQRRPTHQGENKGSLKEDGGIRLFDVTTLFQYLSYELDSVEGDTK